MGDATQPDLPEPRRTRRGIERDALLRARAADLFLTRGFDGVTIDDILREVGGSKASVYSFYGGKDGLFMAAIEDAILDLTQPLKQLRLGACSLEQGLTDFAATLLGILLGERHLAFQRLVIAEAVRHPQIGQSWYRHGPATTHSVLAGFLAEQQALGQVRRDADPGRLATLFHDMTAFDLLSRAMMGIEGGPTPHDVEAVIRDAVRLVTQSLRTQP